MNKLGLWLFNLACKLNPAIPLAMAAAAQRQAVEIDDARAEARAAAIALAQHQQLVASIAASQ